MKSADFILVNFIRIELSLHNPRQILYQLMRNRELLLKKVKQYTDSKLNPLKKKTFTIRLGMTMKKLSQLMKSWNFWKFLSLIMSKHCQFLMIKIFNYTTEDYPTHVL